MFAQTTAHALGLSVTVGMAARSAGMPWKDTRPVEQRIKFIEARLSGEHSMVTLCRMFGISTKTGYKW